MLDGLGSAAAALASWLGSGLDCSGLASGVVVVVALEAAGRIAPAFVVVALPVALGGDAFGEPHPFTDPAVRPLTM